MVLERLQLLTAIVDTGNAKLSSIRPVNPGVGYTVAPTVTVADPNIITGRGNYLYNDLVVGQTSNTEAIVRSWDADTKVLKNYKCWNWIYRQWIYSG